MVAANRSTLATFVVGYIARGHYGQRFARVRARNGVEAVRRARLPGGELANADRLEVLTCDLLTQVPQTQTRAA